jgi:hypothetical protein
MVLLMSACNPNPQIAELSSATTTYDETININNCGNKAESAQTASRSFSTKISGTGTIKAGYDKIIEGSVSSTYEQFRNNTKTQTLTAAPDTNMEFVLRWSDDVRTGSATINGESANYTVNIPISVAQISSRDLGCASLTGTWQGTDPSDGSVTTITLIQAGNVLSGTYNDSYSGNNNPPGWHGDGSGTTLSPTTAHIIFDVSRWDNKTGVFDVQLLFSSENNTITVNNCIWQNEIDTAGCPMVLQRK